MPETERNIESRIAETAQQPKSYENDGEKITNHSLPELIEADRYLAKKKASRNPWGAIKGARISTQGPER